MLIGQITDLHIDAADSVREHGKLRRLERVLARLNEGPMRPDMLLMSGDLTEHGDPESFAMLADAVRDCPFPVWPMAGNHDARTALLGAFPQTPKHQGFIQYELKSKSFRVLVLDTMEEGRHGGAFCDTRAQWLSARLAADPETPTLIAMHHPPAELGIAWLDPSEDEPWIRRFAGTIAGHRQVRAIISGHVHRTVHTSWNGIALTVCASTAPQVALDLRAIDRDRPDNRAMVVDGPPCFALHRWDGKRLVSHIEAVGDHRVLARYDEAMLPSVRDMMDER